MRTYERYYYVYFRIGLCEKYCHCIRSLTSPTTDRGEKFDLTHINWCFIRQLEHSLGNCFFRTLSRNSLYSLLNHISSKEVLKTFPKIFFLHIPCFLAIWFSLFSINK